jgi:AcrR family transcriptional regulator
MSEHPTKRGPGRPRSFDEAEALDAAIALFWRKGYDATSLDDLGDAMGLARPSIYRAFGAKDQLFLHALTRYRETTAASPFAALAATSDVRTGLLAFLDAVITYTNADPSHPGCLIGSLATAVDDDRVRAFAGESVTGVESQVSTWLAAHDPSLDAALTARRAVDAMLALTARARLGTPAAELRATLPDHLSQILA